MTNSKRDDYTLTSNRLLCNIRGRAFGSVPPRLEMLQSTMLCHLSGHGGTGLTWPGFSPPRCRKMEWYFGSVLGYRNGASPIAARSDEFMQACRLTLPTDHPCRIYSLLLVPTQAELHIWASEWRWDILQSLGTSLPLRLSKGPRDSSDRNANWS